MNRCRRHLAFAAIVAGALTVATAGLAQTQPSTGSASQSTSTASHQMHQDMMSGMSKMHEMKPSGDADKDYAHMMQHHHEQAVKMTQSYLRGAKDPQLKAWAQKTLQSQQKELAELKKVAPKQ